MYVIVDIQGQQFKVELDQKLFVHRINAEQGAIVEFNKVMLADKDGAIGSSTSDSERAMITEDVTEVLTLIYSFSGNDGLEKALEYGRKYLEEYAGAQNLESWIVE